MRISIITVTYNRAHIIRDCIESVLKQKFKDYEYIIVDGVSKDNTVEILKEYEPKFEGRMRWISEPDKGLYDAINKGIKMAEGEIVGIINSDDFFHREDAFNIIDSAFSSKDVPAIYGDTRLSWDKSSRKKNRSKIESASYFRTWMYRIGLMPGHQTFYARRELFEKYGYYKTNFKIAADFELLLRFAYINKLEFKYVKDAYMTFRMGGISSRFSNKMLLNKETIRACRENGLYCNHLMICLKYFFKLKKIF